MVKSLPSSRLPLTAAACGALAVCGLLLAEAAPARAAPASRAIQLPPRLLQGAARVIDGDTLALGAERVRLYGIDAPERSQSCTRAGQRWRCGREAGEALERKIAGRPVRCEVLDRDRYGRHLARCRASQVDLGGWMVRQGFAVAYRKYALDYVDQERRARLARVGVWSGEFMTPEDYRRS
jgi:endonuclease YncB( thermonuclease family)